MKVIKGLGVWLVSTIALYIVACLSFPTDNTNTLILPDWYTAIFAIAPIICAIFAVRHRKNRASTDEPSGFLIEVPFNKKKREDMAADLLASASLSADLASSAVHVTTFIEEWDAMIQALTQLIAFEGKVAFKDGTPTADVYKLNSEFQWKLRDAIERAKEHALSEVSGKYRNSPEHKEMRCRWFEQDIEEVSHRFSDETKSFADAALREVRSAVGITQVASAPSHVTLASEFAKYGGVEAELLTIDLMDGHDFEYWCANLLRKIGFTNVEVTPGSGDHGVDILAQKESIKYAIQCKCYASDLGNTPIQEVHAGKAMYHCQVGAVMTNRHFTAGGRQLAEATGTLLWDRDWISNALAHTQK